MAVSVNDGALEFDAVVYMKQFQQQLNTIERGLQGITDTANKEAKSIENLVSKTVGAISVFAAGMSASSFITDVVKVRAEFQKLEAVLTNSLGSNSDAQKALQMISDYVARTPFELAEVSAAYVKLVNQGIKPTKEQLTSIGDLAASTGKSFDQLAEAIIDAQTGEFERLKEFGIRASKEGDKVAFTFKGVTKEVEFTNQAIRDYVIGLGNMQGVTGATAAISATLGGQISNFRDAWTRMLNEIGQSNEGAFSAVISAANAAVTNYQAVLDVIKVLVITYGSYKAAIIATNAVQAIATSITKGYTIAETLRYQALLLSEKVMKLLNATMLKNPAVLIATGVAALVSALVIFNRTATTASKVQSALNDVQTESQKILIQEKTNLEALLKVAKDETQSKEKREAAMKKLNALSPEFLGNLDLEKIKTEEGTTAVNAYIESLDRKARAQAANAAIQKLYEDKINKQAQITDGQNLNLLERTGKFLADLSGDEALSTSLTIKGAKNTVDELDLIEKKIESIKETYKDDLTEQLLGDGKKEDSRKRTVAVIDAEIKALKEKQSTEAASSAEYISFQTKINALEEERKRIVGATKSEIKSLQAQENRLNKILEERASLIEFINGLKAEAKDTNLSKEQAELDRINKKYDEAIEKVDKFNKSVDQFNKANKTNVQKIGLAQINAINDARNLEIKNFNTQLDVEKFKDTLDKQRDLFEQYEEAKKQIGVEKANELFAAQTEGFESYIEYLNQQAGTLAIKSQLGIANDADKAKFKLLVKEITEFENKSEAERLKARINNIARVFQETATFNQKKAALDRQYEDDLKTLRTEFAGEELERQIANLRKRYGAEREALENSMITQSDLYQKLNQDILGFSRDRIRQEIDILKKQLKVGTFTDASGKQQVISPAFRKQLEDYIEGLKEFLKTTSELTKDGGKLQHIADRIGFAAQEAMALADAFDGVNDGISQTMREISGVADIASNALASVGQFMSGDIAGGIQSAIKAITGVIKKIKEISDSFEQTKIAIAEFNQAILFGEIDINIQYRERLAIQASLNKLRLEGIRDERAALEQSKQANADEYSKILQLLQAESFVSSTKQKTKNTFLSLITGFGKKSEVEKELSSLAGKSFEEIEKLFATGQLTDKAKQLFEQLRELRDEGVNIDQMLEENKRKAQEMFTGTTVDSLVDTIANGFANGLRSASDFADTFESYMRGAMINSLKFQYLEGPLKEFFQAFADASQSDGQLSQSEIDTLRNYYNSILSNFSDQVEQFEQIAGMSVSNAAGSGNALAGAIKGMTEETAQLLAGQFGGLRLTAIEQLNVSKQGLIAQQKIEINTALTVARLEQQTTNMYQWFMVQGIKVQ